MIPGTFLGPRTFVNTRSLFSPTEGSGKRGIFVAQSALCFFLATIPACLLSLSLQAWGQESPLKADFDRDGSVDLEDFFLFAGVFGTGEGEENFDAKFDLDGNGRINFGDFFLFAEDFGKKEGDEGGGATEEVTAYIADQFGGPLFEGTIEIVNLQDNLSVGTINVPQPRGLAFSPNGSFLYVASTDSFRAFLPDGAFEFSLPIDNGLNVAVSPDGQRGYVTVDVLPFLGDTRGVAVVDLTSKSQAKFIPLPGSPRGIALTIDGQKAYVGNRTDQLLVIDLVAEALKDSILTTNAITSEVSLSPDGKIAYLSNEIGDTINVVDTETDRVVKFFATKPDEPHRESRLENVEVSRDGKSIYATLLRNVLTIVPGSTDPVPTLIGEFIIIDEETSTVERIELGEVIDVFGVAPDGKTAYAMFVTQNGGVELGFKVVDLESKEAIGSLPVTFEFPVDIKFRRVIK